VVKENGIYMAKKKGSLSKKNIEKLKVYLNGAKSKSGSKKP